MSCVDEAVCGRFGPPTFAQHLGQVIALVFSISISLGSSVSPSVAAWAIDAFAPSSRLPGESTGDDASDGRSDVAAACVAGDAAGSSGTAARVIPCGGEAR